MEQTESQKQEVKEEEKIEENTETQLEVDTAKEPPEDDRLQREGPSTGACMLPQPRVKI